MRKDCFTNSNVTREMDLEIEESVERKNAYVKQLNVHDFQSIHLEDSIHDKANDMFIWITECIYFES